MALTKRQREILTFLSSYSEQNGYAPSFEEIARQFNYNSLATVHEHLSNLERKGYIKRSYNESRAIEILPSDVFPKAVDLPLLGSVAAGLPIEALEANETISVPESLLGRTYYKPTDQGFEARIRQRLEEIRKIQTKPSRK